MAAHGFRALAIGLLGLLAVASSQPAAAAPAPATMRFEGRVVGGNDSVATITLTRTGPSLRFTIRFQAPCKVAGVVESLQYGTGQTPSIEQPERLTKKLGFKHVRRGLNPGLGTSIMDVDFSGRITRTAAYGYFSVTTQPQRSPTGPCASGLLRWVDRLLSR